MLTDFQSSCDNLLGKRKHERESVDTQDSSQFETFDYEAFENNQSGESQEGDEQISPADKRLKMATYFYTNVTEDLQKYLENQQEGYME